ncbi:branched-chain amino acid transport system substrate-binding protein [Anaerobacterium chartisolvens]|uniref:Branched-chain amino acid transport system substrate-binding protein n=1 Tax=Anaerobacterium chartisolvens TaxID=1297424 RepID=A0A369B6Z3_9FIRM|nr:ABC transporter substrate-binding protein [Anaerobacterium chartisolvens]RCX17191.1 branched-chain amino acid transport system substrate-binding protein [Anaerobacterium chartisolvens]
MSKGKKFLNIFLAAVIIASVLTACGQPAASQDVVRIGLNYELSGGSATYGQGTVDGIMMAIDEVNAAGGVLGKKIEVVKADNKSEPAEATSVATRFATKDKVTAILGPATTGATKATIPVGNKNNVPIISASATADDVTVDAKGVKEYAYRICFNDSFQGTVMANFASNNLKAKSAVIIKDNSSDYGIGLAKNFTDTFKASGGTIVEEEAFVKDDTDFSAILTKIKNKQFDILLISGYYNEAGLIIKQAKDLGIDKPVLGGDGFDSPKLAELAGKDKLNNVYFSNHYSSLDQSPEITKFIEDFKAKYKKSPDAFNALGYDLGKFIADAIKRADSADSVKVKQALDATTDFKGVTGQFSIDKNHNPVKTAVVIELKNGEQAGAVKVQP